ncbi:MAG: DNA polymerase I [Myxococcales bacterium]|nr:DNA polymerase I [Myxococcales bacterium]
MATLPAPGTQGVLFLVDLSGYVFRAYHAITPLSSSKGEPTHAVLGTVNMLNKVVNERRPHMLAVAADSRAPSFRKAIDPRYKATRPPAPPDLAGQMARAYEVVHAYNIPVFEKEGIEADDLIAAVAARATADGLRVVVVSSDKDLMQVVHDDDEEIVLWDSMRDRVFGPREVHEKWGVKPSQVRDLLALMGDTSDNVPGVPGVGPKTAADLLVRFGSIEGIYTHLEELKKGKIKENLVAHRADAEISRELVTLRADTEIPWDKEKLVYGGADRAELRRLFTELEFFRLLDERTEARQPAVSAPAAAPKAAPRARTVAVVTTRAELERVCARATEAKTLGIAVALSGEEVMRADVIGLSIAPREGEAHYVPLGHRYLGAPAQLAWPDVAEVVGPLLASKAIVKSGYDLKNVEIALAKKGVALGGPTFDAMLAAYLLDPESPHALKDLAKREGGQELDEGAPPSGRGKAARVPFDELEVERGAELSAPRAELGILLASRLGSRLEGEGLAKLFADVEMPLSHVLARMEQVGVRVDTSKLAAVATRIEKDLERLEARAKELAGHDFAIRSRDQLESILFDQLGLPVVKRTPKGGRSTDAVVLEELAERHPLPQVIVDYRELDKLKGTYLEALPRAVNPATGRIHTRFDQAVAATGRLSSNAPNLQNIPIRTEVGREIRAAFVPAPGHVLVSADYSQIELRVLAHLSKDERLVEAFATRQDVHTHTASVIFDVPRSEVTAEMRRRSKTINFGVIYGMGEAALATQLGISRDEASRFIAAYFHRYEGVRAFMERTVAEAKRGEAVRTLLGRRRFLPNLHSANRGLRFEAERVAKNTPIQGTAADIIKLAMVKLGDGDVVPGARMILTVHDELVFEVPEAGVAEAEGHIREAMSQAIHLDVPLDVDVGHGPSWAAAH